MLPLVNGIGINDRKYPMSVKGKSLKVYTLWRNLLERCYSPKYQEKFPTYIGCQASENFKSYSYFYEWCQNQTGFGQENYHLDKDLIFRGNKLYSEETCLFLPRDLNSLFISRKNGRGSLPIGVCAQGDKFQAEVHCGKSSLYLGGFSTPEQAFYAYKQAKEARIKAQAQKWKAHIDPRAFAALMAYEVQITD